MKKNIREKKGLIIFMVFAGLTLAIPLQNSFAQQYEYEADEGLHQEEWYDPSDWFNSGGGINYESDWNDYYYGYDSYDPWYDNDWMNNREFGLAPEYGNDRLYDNELYDYNYYTENWYDDTFNNWYEDNTSEQ